METPLIKQILSLTKQGKSGEAIASELGISENVIFSIKQTKLFQLSLEKVSEN